MRIKEETIEGYRCKCAYPDDFEEKGRYGLLVFLHGAGERGEDISLLNANGPFFEMEKGREYPCVVIAPQLIQGTWFDKFEHLQAFVQAAVERSYIDTNRAYLSGVSMGGFASWQLLMSMPNTFAAAMICCGGGMSWNAPSIAHIPVWAFHGALDDVVPLDLTVRMTNVINMKGGEAKLTVYENSWHDCWVKAFADEVVYKWLFSKIKEVKGA